MKERIVWLVIFGLIAIFPSNASAAKFEYDIDASGSYLLLRYGEPHFLQYFDIDPGGTLVVEGPKNGGLGSASLQLTFPGSQNIVPLRDTYVYPDFLEDGGVFTANSNIFFNTNPDTGDLTGHFEILALVSFADGSSASAGGNYQAFEFYNPSPGTIAGIAQWAGLGPNGGYMDWELGIRAIRRDEHPPEHPEHPAHPVPEPATMLLLGVGAAAGLLNAKARGKPAS